MEETTCGDKEDDQHVIRCSLMGVKSERNDLFREPNDGVIELTEDWFGKEIIHSSLTQRRRSIFQTL